MRQDQFERLQEIIEKLTDVLIDEADPATWPGAGMAPTAMDAKTRGDRYWTKKNAAATLALNMRCINLVGVIQNRGGIGEAPADVEHTDPEEVEREDDMDRAIASAEREAARRVEQMATRTIAKAKRTTA